MSCGSVHDVPRVRRNKSSRPIRARRDGRAAAQLVKYTLLVGFTEAVGNIHSHVKETETRLSLVPYSRFALCVTVLLWISWNGPPRDKGHDPTVLIWIMNRSICD